MELVKVNLTIEQSVWEKFSNMVPKRKKSQIINKLLKEEINKVEKQKEMHKLLLGFQEASEDQDRLAEIKAWDIIDSEGWD